MKTQKYILPLALLFSVLVQSCGTSNSFHRSHSRKIKKVRLFNDRSSNEEVVAADEKNENRTFSSKEAPSTNPSQEFEESVFEEESTEEVQESRFTQNSVVEDGIIISDNELQPEEFTQLPTEEKMMESDEELGRSNFTAIYLFTVTMLLTTALSIILADMLGFFTLIPLLVIVSASIYLLIIKIKKNKTLAPKPVKGSMNAAIGLFILALLITLLASLGIALIFWSNAAFVIALPILLTITIVPFIRWFERLQGK